MVDRILNMRVMDDFISVSCDLLNKSNRSALYDSIVDSGLVMLSEDAWTPEELDCIARRSNGVVDALDMTVEEPKSARLLHRLQLIGWCNPGICRYIQQVLQRACV